MIIIDIKDNKSKEYLEKENIKYIDYIYNNCVGEIIIDNLTDELVGYVFVKQKEETGFIFDLFVKEQYRNYGIGNQLINDCINLFNGIDLLVDTDNFIAIGLYIKNGFLIKKKISNQYWMVKMNDRDFEQYNTWEWYLNQRGIKRRQMIIARIKTWFYMHFGR